MSKDKLIPELRFPEFLEKEGWEIKEVGEIFQVTRGYVLSMTLVKELPTEDYPYPVFSSQTKNNGLAGYYNEYLYEDAITWTTDGANAGDVNYRDGKFYCTNVCGVLLNEEGIANPCIAELINSVSKKHVSYVGNPKLMNGVMSKIQIPVPSIKEQQKIASCLSSLDELLTAHNDKLDALKDHKKGLLQNLFPQEGETVPKVRFPEFEGDGEWVEDDIGSIFKFKQGVQVPVGNQFPEQGDDMVRFIRIIDITSNTEPPRYIENPGDAHIINKDDLFMIRYGTPGLISIGFEGVIANNLFRLIWKSKKRNHPKYWFYAFQRLESFIYNLSSSSSMPAISFSTLEDLKIGFPPTIHEQQKIASCLSAVDELITAQQEKIEQLQQHKKGLMQGLFPKIES